jgi:hypothetical protein
MKKYNKYRYSMLTKTLEKNNNNNKLNKNNARGKL